MLRCKLPQSLGMNSPSNVSLGLLWQCTLISNTSPGSGLSSFNEVDLEASVQAPQEPKERVDLRAV